MEPTQRQIARLLGYPTTAALTDGDLNAGLTAQPERAATGLVDEAFASDDVGSAAEARSVNVPLCQNSGRCRLILLSPK